MSRACERGAGFYFDALLDMAGLVGFAAVVEPIGDRHAEDRMDRQHRLVGLVFAAVALLGVEGCTASGSADRETAISKAKLIYLEKKSAGADLSNGPCIAEDLMPGWVADIAHQPRQPVDDLAQNQCQKYRQGKARHFVELDAEGNLIRAQ